MTKSIYTFICNLFSLFSKCVFFFFLEWGGWGDYTNKTIHHLWFYSFQSKRKRERKKKKKKDERSGFVWYIAVLFLFVFILLLKYKNKKHTRTKNKSTRTYIMFNAFPSPKKWEKICQQIRPIRCQKIEVTS